MIGADLLVVVLALAGPAFGAESALERAVQAELGRAKAELRADGYPSIYEAALTIWDLDDWDRWSAMGATRAEAVMRQRIVLPDLRVGSRELDNHPVSPRNDYMGVPVGFEEDEFALRHSLWRLFDVAYKAAAADFLRKQAQRVSRGKTEYDTDDLSMEPPVTRRPAPASAHWSLDRLRLLDDELSEQFRRVPGLLHAESHIGLRRLSTRRRGTDGTAVDKNDDWAKIEIEAAVLSPDGLSQSVFRDWYARVPEALPTGAELSSAAREMITDLEELRIAATTSPFSAPALLDPSVAAALVFSLGQRLSGEEQRNPAGAQTFRGRIGARVLPEFMTLVDDPTRQTFRGSPLFGHYEFDDQGVPARRVVLVERGVLKGYLLSRYPVKGFPRSNGHGRAPIGQMPVGTPGALFLTTSDPQPAARLLEGLRGACRAAGKPYGLWVRRLRASVQQQGSGGQGSIRFAAQVFLVEASSGRIQRVRDLDLVGTPLVMAGSVLAAGDDTEVSDINAVAPTSIITPSLLLAEAELQRSETKPEKPPILPPPPAPPPEPPPSRRGPPTVPRAAFTQTMRYFLHGRTEKIKDLSAEGVVAWRQMLTPRGLVVDARVVGSSLQDTGAALRRLDAAVAVFSGGAHERAVLSTMMTTASYRARFGAGWPASAP